MEERRKQFEQAVKKEVQEFIMTDAQLQVIVDCKHKVESVIKFIEQLEKIQGSNKQSRNAKKTMQKFLNCHITNPAIYKRYQEVMILMEKYANGNKA